VVGNTARRENGAGGIGGGVNNFEGSLTLSNESSIFENTAQGGPGSGGGVFNRGTVTLNDRSNISGNTPDNCVNDSGGTGCPA
jgi:hypothetical protein